jgi:hypothetical protein
MPKKESLTSKASAVETRKSPQPGQTKPSWWVRSVPLNDETICTYIYLQNRTRLEEQRGFVGQWAQYIVSMKSASGIFFSSIITRVCALRSGDWFECWPLKIETQHCGRNSSLLVIGFPSIDRQGSGRFVNVHT